jgi:AcrR family transcriptional regulator
MARPTSITNGRILDAARSVFLAHGFANASTVEIARRAGISEGSIFHRFATKEGLFEAAMDETVPPALTLLQYTGKGNLKLNLVRITVQSIAFLTELLPSLMLRWSERERADRSVCCGRPTEILRGFTNFFTQEAALGRVSGDPRIAARIFMGAVWNYSFLQTVAGDRSMSARTFARGLVDELWRGIAPERRTRKRNKRIPA